MIYLDSGATTWQKPRQVFRAVQKAMESCANPGRSGHRPAREAERVVYSCREEAAEFFGLDRPERVVFYPKCHPQSESGHQKPAP